MQINRLPSGLTSKILTIGPDYHNHRGGVGAVIDVYNKYYEVLNFIPSHKPGSVFRKIYVFLISLVRLFTTLLTNREIKIIHIHGSSYGSFYRKFIIFIICKYIFRKSIIYHIHGGAFKVFYENSNNLTKRWIRILFGGADIVICLSQSWFGFYEQNFRIKKLIILPNIIDYPAIENNSAETNFMTLLFLGWMSRPKGIFDLIEVIAKNKEKYGTRIRLLIGGSGETRQLTDLISQHHIENIVEFMGWVSNERKEYVLNHADVYILPSYNEGLPISILESMSYGKAIIATNVGGIPEIVKDRENGLLIEPGNKEQIEIAINYLLEHPGLVKKYGKNSLQMVQKHLPDSVLNELSKIYTSLLSNE